MGELEEIDATIQMIMDGMDNLKELQKRRAKLVRLIDGAEQIITENHPDWQNKVKPRKKGKWRSPFANGELGRRALEVLREEDRWMRPREIAIKMLEAKSIATDDRVTLDRVTNSVGGYFAKHEGDLVESTSEYAKKWRLIPDLKACVKN
ncbi:hypothetical protein CD351_09020 [Erythrobacter sp. KY5]|nr:hypothetical protein CD351_09020 [Erythrobacter sp. KY5]